MLQLAGILANELSVRTGLVVGVEGGRVLVLMEGTADPIPAFFLRTSAGPLPEIREGDSALLALDRDGERAYVLGLIETYAPPAVPDAEATPGTDKVHVRGRTIHIEAGEELELRCGEGTIRIDQRGKIVVRGNEVVSRARGRNKVKGASVAIN